MSDKNVNCTEAQGCPETCGDCELKDVEEIYIVIRCGYEGIDSLCFGTTNKEKAIKKFLELKSLVSNAKKHLQELYEKDGDGMDKDDFYDKLLSDKVIEYEEYSRAMWDDEDSYCIREWKGDYFLCICSQVGHPPSEPWLM